MPNSSTPLPLPQPDANPSPAPNLTPLPDAKKRRQPSLLNQRQQGQIQRAKQVCLAAKDTAHASRLATREISAEFVQNVENDIGSVESVVTTALACDNKKAGAVLTETDAAETLIRDIREVQSAVRQKYYDSNPEKLKDFWIGERVDANEATLDQAAESILEHLKTERPPGIDNEFISAMTLHRAAFNAATGTQTREGGRAMTARESRDAMVDSIVRRTRQIQFAADAEWPARQSGHSGVRRQFLLPLTRPFAG